MAKVILFAGGILGLTLAGWSNRAAAQTPTASSTESTQPGTRLEEIVVSARRRSESLQDVPIAMAPITKAQLENNDATSFANLAELAPQVMIGTTATGTGAVLGIRGISSGATDSGMPAKPIFTHQHAIFDGYGRPSIEKLPSCDSVSPEGSDHVCFVWL